MKGMIIRLHGRKSKKQPPLKMVVVGVDLVDEGGGFGGRGVNRGLGFHNLTLAFENHDSCYIQPILSFLMDIIMD